MAGRIDILITHHPCTGWIIFHLFLHIRESEISIRQLNPDLNGLQYQGIIITINIIGFIFSLYVENQNKKIYIFCWWIYFTVQNLHLLGYSAEAFHCHVHHCQCLEVPEELAVMWFVFMSIVVVIAEMLVWLACVIVSKIIQHVGW